MKFCKVLLLFLLILFCFAANVWCCGPNIPEAVFSYSLQPDAPFEKFAKGELGVLRPTFYEVYLVGAYRYLNGPGLDREEQKAIIDYWKQPRYDGYEKKDPADEWTDLIKKMPGFEKNDHQPTYRAKKKKFNWYLNCSPDSFETAIKTLKSRIKEFGETSPYVKDWLDAQLTVFSNCNDGKSIPQPANDNAPQLIKKDRAYQIAAAYFYSEDFDKAENLFREIAKDEHSPWSKLAPYLAVRSIVRRSDLCEDQDAVTLLRQAKSELTNIMANPAYREIHRACTDLLNTVNYRLNPSDRLTELSQSLIKEHSSEEIAKMLADFRYIYNEGIRSSQDLTAWIDSFKRRDFSNSFRYWQQTHSAYWLLASLSSISPTDPNLPNLLLEADKISTESYAYPSIVYSSLRLLMQTGHKEEARQKLEKYLVSEENKLPASALNLFASLQMQLSKNLDEFVIYSKRRPIGVYWPVEGEGITKELEPRMQTESFYKNSASVYNTSLPLSVLIKTLQNPQMPNNLKRWVVISAWTKSVLLKQRTKSQELALVSEKLWPELKKDIKYFLMAKSDKDREFAFAYIALRNPGIQPFIKSGFGRDATMNSLEMLRDNWWCSIDTELEKMERENKFLVGEDELIMLPDFLSPQEKVEAAKELNDLSRIESGPVYLGRIVLNRVKSDPQDSLLAEALHLVVRSTRYGCYTYRQEESDDKETTTISKAAFKILHKRYPGNPWTQKTPYWF